MNSNLTVEQYKKLYEFKDLLNDVQKNQVARNIISVKRKELANIYKDITNVTKCSSCSDKWIIALAAWFHSYETIALVAKLEAEKAKTEDEIQIETGDTEKIPIEEPKPKPKKVTKNTKK